MQEILDALQTVELGFDISTHGPEFRVAWKTLKDYCTQPTDTQQLQAKIRAVADKLFVCHFQSGSGGLDNLALINELRELSAVQ